MPRSIELSVREAFVGRVDLFDEAGNLVLELLERGVVG